MRPLGLVEEKEMNMNGSPDNTSAVRTIRFEGGESLERIERTFDNLAALFQARSARRAQLKARAAAAGPTRNAAFRHTQHEKWLGRGPVVIEQNARPKDLHRRVLQDPSA